MDMARGNVLVCSMSNVTCILVGHCKEKEVGIIDHLLWLKQFSGLV